MTTISESELAWDLVEFNRDQLSQDECSTAFVHLGAGDFLLALLYVLELLVHKQIRLNDEFGARLVVWADTYEISRTAQELLSRAIGDGPAQVDMG
jgi:hypothetical protein